jgi:hypothetical protein
MQNCSDVAREEPLQCGQTAPAPYAAQGVTGDRALSTGTSALDAAASQVQEDAQATAGRAMSSMSQRELYDITRNPLTNDYEDISDEEVSATTAQNYSNRQPSAQHVERLNTFLHQSLAVSYPDDVYEVPVFVRGTKRPCPTAAASTSSDTPASTSQWKVPRRLDCTERAAVGTYRSSPPSGALDPRGAQDNRPPRRIIDDNSPAPIIPMDGDQESVYDLSRVRESPFRPIQNPNRPPTVPPRPALVTPPVRTPLPQVPLHGAYGGCPPPGDNYHNTVGGGGRTSQPLTPQPRPRPAHVHPPHRPIHAISPAMTPQRGATPFQAPNPSPGPGDLSRDGTPYPSPAPSVVRGGGGGEAHSAPQAGSSPLDAVAIPKTEPMDKVGISVRPKVKNIIDGIYHNPLTKALTAEIYERYPRPENLNVLHKTRINEEVLEELDAPKINIRAKTVSRDAPYNSMQWCLQFAVRPLIGVLQHIDEGQSDPEFVAKELCTAIKLISRTSWRLNDMRRAFLKQNVGGPVLALTRENNTQGFEFLLGDNLREEVLSRTKVHETFKDLVIPLGGANYNKNRNQGNSRAGHARGRDRRNGYKQGGQRSNQQQQRYNNNNSNQNGQSQSNSTHRGGRQGGGSSRQNYSNNQNRNQQRGGGNPHRSGGGNRRGGNKS